MQATSRNVEPATTSSRAVTIHSAPMAPSPTHPSPSVASAATSRVTHPSPSRTPSDGKLDTKSLSSRGVRLDIAYDVEAAMAVALPFFERELAQFTRQLERGDRQLRAGNPLGAFKLHRALQTAETTRGQMECIERGAGWFKTRFGWTHARIDRVEERTVQGTATLVIHIQTDSGVRRAWTGTRFQATPPPIECTVL